MATECNNIFPGRQPAWYNHLFISFGFTKPSVSTLKRGKESFPETLKNFRALTQLSAREDFIQWFTPFSKCTAIISHNSINRLIW